MFSTVHSRHCKFHCKLFLLTICFTYKIFFAAHPFCFIFLQQLKRKEKTATFNKWQIQFIAGQTSYTCQRLQKHVLPSSERHLGIVSLTSFAESDCKQSRQRYPLLNHTAINVMEQTIAPYWLEQQPSLIDLVMHRHTTNRGFCRGTSSSKSSQF